MMSRAENTQKSMKQGKASLVGYATSDAFKRRSGRVVTPCPLVCGLLQGITTALRSCASGGGRAGRRLDAGPGLKGEFYILVRVCQQDRMGESYVA